MGNVTESIFDGKYTVIPLADVQHVEKKYHTSDLVNGPRKGDLMGFVVVTKHTRWDMDADVWANNIYLDADEGQRFMAAWCSYRHELEIDTLADLAAHENTSPT